MFLNTYPGTLPAPTKSVNDFPIGPQVMSQNTLVTSSAKQSPALSLRASEASKQISSIKSVNYFPIGSNAMSLKASVSSTPNLARYFKKVFFRDSSCVTPDKVFFNILNTCVKFNATLYRILTAKPTSYTHTNYNDSKCANYVGEEKTRYNSGACVDQKEFSTAATTTFTFEVASASRR